MDNGDSTTYNNTQVAAKQVQIDSGGDTTLKGAVVKADQVTANVGGNLNIESLQDSATYKDKQNSAGVGVSICVPPFCFGQAVIVNVSAAKAKINSDYQSVTEQSGLKAGDGGFTVNVKGNTDLKGGAITSTQAAIDNNKNTFNTGGSLSTSDLQNQAAFEAKSVSVSISTGGGGAAGFGSDSGQASSTTKAAISGIAGDTAARTGDKEAGIKPIFDAQKVKADVQLQTAVTGEFGRNASKAVGDYAAKQKEALNKQASQENDPAKKAAIQAEIAKWEEGGAYRVAAHTVVGGLTGGVAGAAGAGTVSAAAPTLDEVQGQMAQALVKAGMEAKTAQGLAGAVTGVGAAGIGAAVSGGTTAGPATAFNADVNNRQLHPDERMVIRRTAATYAKKYGLTTDQAIEILESQAMRQVDAAAAATTPENADAARFLSFVGSGRMLPDGGASLRNGQQATPYFQATIRQYNDPTFFATAQPSNYYDRQLPDYMTIQGGAFGASGSLSLNLHNGDAFVGGSKTNISSSPGGSLTFGTMLDQPPANVPRATAVSNMLDGGGVQAGACAFVMCIGVNQSLAPNGQPRPTAIEWGLGTPGASVGTGASFPVGRPK